MRRLVLIVLVGVTLSGEAVAGVVPAATELPVVVKYGDTFQPGSEKEVRFTVENSRDSSGFGVAAQGLAGCELRASVKLDPKTERLIATQTNIHCNKTTKNGRQISGGQIAGQLVGNDHKNGFLLECKGKPQCLVGTLKPGDVGSFLVIRDFGI